MDQCLSPVRPRILLNRYRSFREERKCFRMAGEVHQCTNESNGTEYFFVDWLYDNSLGSFNRLEQFAPYKNLQMSRFKVYVEIYLQPNCKTTSTISHAEGHINLQCNELFTKCTIFNWYSWLIPRSGRIKFMKLLSEVFVVSASEGGEDYEESDMFMEDDNTTKNDEEEKSVRSLKAQSIVDGDGLYYRVGAFVIVLSLIFACLSVKSILK